MSIFVLSVPFGCMAILYDFVAFVENISTPKLIYAFLMYQLYLNFMVMLIVCVAARTDFLLRDAKLFNFVLEVLMCIKSP